MPPKRKRTDEHPPPPYCEGPRRSARILGDHTAKNANNDTREPSKMDVDPSGHEPIQAIWETKEGVQQAVRELSEMEHKFQNVVRRQRLAVLNSRLAVAPGLPDETAAKPKPSIPIRGAASKNVGKRDVGNKKAEAKQSSTEKSPLDGYQTDINDVDPTPEADSADRGANRTPPVNSDRLPLPWSGRLGYACLNTYLRAANPPVFSSRTCRIASIIDHRYPLQSPSEPEHPTKNRRDKSKTPDIEQGQQYLQQLGLANARDIVKMLRWNEKYGIKFMRLSSEMFPFASHAEYGYSLAPFASEALAEAGKVVAELGHRLTTHPGQFTQIGSPRKEVVTAAFRDLEYQNEMLTLLKLPKEIDRDAVMILHMGGTYGDKAATLDRFRENYAKLSDSIKRRLVLENDDVSWTVHDLLPICEELNIPLVLDFHHHNILFDPCIREGTHDIIDLFDRIKRTWTKKGIRQKMHYSEQTRSAITPRERRKHSPRVKTLPPCVQDMDLMIEAKDKEQAVFELMRTFKLPGWDRFNDVVPHEREDESRKAIKRKPKKAKKRTTGWGEAGGELEAEIEAPERIVSPDDFAMGGSNNRVYWPEGMEEWLRPKKRETKKGKKEGDSC
ncbi:UV-damage endonuclease [Neonectria ditissima]|uniref:UV-damage endonuclease n=1 Tax=Neonectria ditissima TaxID=78410 RepID=A0A0P7BL34_9HYPO|nr:UV-damage endonuclease [Neonectria ditissima]